MATLSLTAQDVNGDPYTSGGTINIVNGSTTSLTFIDSDYLLTTPQDAEYVSLDGGTTKLTYEFLGYGDVRGDTQQHAAFIRVHLSNGTCQTYAIDMNADGDALPNLQTGNTKLTVAGLDTTGGERFPAPACFTTGTLIETANGPMPVEALRQGDLIRTLDHGLQPLREVLSETVRAEGDLAPIRFEVGVLGNTRSLLVSPQHRMLIADWRASLYFGEAEIFVAAKHLVNGATIRRQTGGKVTYFHLLFDNHEVIWSEGVLSESFFPDRHSQVGDQGPGGELAALFPGELAKLGQIARPEIRARDAQLIAA